MKLERIEGALKAQANKGGAVSKLLSRQATTLREAHVKPPASGAGVQEDVSAQMCAPCGRHRVWGLGFWVQGRTVRSSGFRVAPRSLAASCVARPGACSLRCEGILEITCNMLHAWLGPAVCPPGRNLLGQVPARTGHQAQKASHRVTMEPQGPER